MPGEGDVEPELDADLRPASPGREAVENRIEAPSPRFLGQDPDHVVVGIPRMDDQRQPGFARSRDMGAEDLLLHVARALVVMVVEAGLADGDAARMLGQGDQPLGRHIRLHGSVVRMRADREEDALMTLCESPIGVEACHMGRDGHHATDAGRSGGRQNLGEAALKIREIQVAMAVDQHR